MMFSLILILVLVFIIWTAIRGARKMSAGHVLEAAVGYLGWFVMNTYLWIWVFNHPPPGTFFLDPSAAFPFFVTMLLLLALSFTRPWITLGMLAAILNNAIGTLLIRATGPMAHAPFDQILGMVPFYISYFLPQF